jgi:hypothetical protein
MTDLSNATKVKSFELSWGYRPLNGKRLWPGGLALFVFGDETTEDEFYLATLDRKIFREK